MLSDLINTLKPLNVPIETGVFTDKAPNEYIVLTPIDEYFLLFGDNAPLVDISSVRISLYTKGNYLSYCKGFNKWRIHINKPSVYWIWNRNYVSPLQYRCGKLLWNGGILMATIGLDKLYYAVIKEDANGDETYSTPVPLAKAISAELSI